MNRFKVGERILYITEMGSMKATVLDCERDGCLKIQVGDCVIWVHKKLCKDATLDEKPGVRKHVEAWANVMSNGMVHVWQTKEMAERTATKHVIARVLLSGSYVEGEKQ